VISFIDRFFRLRVTETWQMSVLLAVAVSWTTGCGRTPGPSRPGQAITVTIHYDNQPVTEGRVELSGQGGGRALNEKGVAEFAHVPFGSYQVMILPPALDDLPFHAEDTPAPLKVYDNIPKPFHNPETTPLAINVQSGQKQEYFFDLKTFSR